MRIGTDAHIRIANGEAVALEMRGASEAESVELRVSGSMDEPISLTLSDGAVTLPRIPECPTLCLAEWVSGGAIIARAYVEVVERHYFALDDLCDYGDGMDGFASMPEERLWAARQSATETIERAANRSFVMRVGSTRVFGSPSLVNLDDCDVSEIISPDVAVLVSDCQVRLPVGAAVDGGRISYVYGYGEVPSRVSKAALDLAAYYLRPDNIPSRAIGESTDAGFLRFTLAGRDGPTGLPDVDAVISQFGRRRLAVM